MAPQIIVIVLWVLGLLIHAVENGKPQKVTNYNFAFRLMNVGILATLLYFGGFFDVFK